MDITQIDTFFQRHRIFAIITLILIAGVIPFAGGFVVSHFFPGWEWSYGEFHSFVTGFGSLMSITIALFILVRIDEGNQNYMLPLACAMLAMGILESFHACINPGPEFVWLHCSAKFAGGLFLAMIWLPERFIQKLTTKRLPKLLGIAFVVIGVISVIYPEMLPEVLTDGKFTLTSKILNVIGGISFLAGGIYFARRFYRSGDVILLLFSSLCFLFGVTGVSFESSILWNTGWWMWHLMRLVACIIALGYIAISSVSEYRRTIYAEKTAKVAYQQLAASEQQLKATTRTLRESEERFRTLVEQSPSAIEIYEPDGRLLLVNDAWTKLWGLKRETMATFNIFDDPQCEGTGATPAFREAQLGRSSTIPDALYVSRASGRRRWISQRIYPTTNHAGKVQNIVLIYDDITERKKAEDALRESGELFKELLGASPAVIYKCEPSGQYSATFISPNIINQMGYKPEDFTGDSAFWSDHIHPDDKLRVFADLANLFEEGGKHKYEYRFLHSDGAYHWMYDETTLIRDVDGRPVGIIGNLLDITDRKKAEEKLVIYQNNLRYLASRLIVTEEEQRRQIASNLHDNINQALALSVNQLQKLRSSANLADSETLDSTRRIIEEVIEHVRDLTFDLGSPTLYKFGLKAAIFEFLDDRLRDQHEITCEFSGDDTDKLLDNNIRVLLFQAVRELLINVIKHAKARRVEVTVERKDESIQICVSDDGIGFDTKITEAPMQRTGGFGLFNIQNQLDFVGGSFEMHSQLGSGSRFILTAPLKTKTD